MKKLFSLIAILCCFAATSFGQAGFEGLWKQVDDETGKAKTHISIYEEDGVYYAKVVKILNPDKQDAVCNKCKSSDSRKDQPILGMVIMKGMKKVREDALKGGNILKADNGKTYRCEMYLQDDPNHLVVKGYVGPVSKKQNWYRLAE